MVVVVGVNTAYVYVVIYESSRIQAFAQIMLSFFKLGWNSLCSPYLLRLIAVFVNRKSVEYKYSEMKYSSLQIFVALFNNIVIPCLVVACTSPNCFYNVFVNAPEIKSTYDFVSCTQITATSVCLQYSVEVGTTTYNPPFTYSYQCSSSLVTYYAPAFVIMCIVDTFFIPSGQLLLQTLHLRATRGTVWFLLLDMLLPRLLKPLGAGFDTDQDDTGAALVPVRVKANRIVVSLIIYLGLILTFGAVFPPLAVSLLVTAMTIAYYTKYKVGNFLLKAEEHDRLLFAEKMQLECSAVGKLPILMSSMWMLISVSACFYTLFLFDTLGDSVGFQGAYWVLIVMPLMPLCMYSVYSWYNHYTSSKNIIGKPAQQAQHNEEEEESGFQPLITHVAEKEKEDSVVFNKQMDDCEERSCSGEGGERRVEGKHSCCVC